MNASEELEQWIQDHGNVRDALNVAIQRLKMKDEEIKFWKGIVDAWHDACMEMKR